MNIPDLIRKRPIISYFSATFFLSWLSAFIVISSPLLRGKPIDKMHGILMFPVMIIWPAIVGIALTKVTTGKMGLQQLYGRIKKSNLDWKWYGIALLVAPALILLVLFFLTHLRSADFAPNYFFAGIAFGVPAGLLEEIGWTGFALPNLRKKASLIRSGIILGLLWSLWHLPVIDFLGAASPHGPWLVAFFFAFTLIMSAMRLLMVLVYEKTGSVLITQLMHMVSTCSLVVFGPPKLSPAQETMWYCLYGGILWIFVLLLVWSVSQQEKKPS